MKAKNIIPAEKISDYVERILVIENGHVVSPFILPLYANGVPSLLFTSVKGQLKNKQSSHLKLFGQTVFPESLTLNSDFILIAYFFKPYALLPLFGVTAKELTDKPLDMTLLAASKNKTIQEQLLNSGSPEGMMHLLDNFIFDLIGHSKSACPLITYAAEQLATRPAKESLVSLQKELHLTERTFQRMFEKNIGLPPNLYRRICQFNSAFVQLNQRNYLSFSDIAFSHGYADQSHYIRAFKEFTSITPTDYAKFGTEA